MPSSSLSDPYLKTPRAKEHLDDLRERLRVFREDKPITITREDDFQNQRHIVRLKVKDIPEKLALVLGDCIFCLRASLDQLVWALAHLTLDYPVGTQFPIFDAADDGQIARRTRGVPTDAVSIMKSLQPYTGQNAAAVHAHLLWRLNKLCNIDKHRRIPTDKNVTIINFPHVPRSEVPLINYDHDAGVINVPLDMKDKMRFDPTASLDVIFGDSYEGIECNLEGLEAIYEFVANSVLPRFARFFK
jgi:hypothetical protein